MDRATLEALLPCYLCGDLPPALNAAIEATVDADAALGAKLGHLGDGRDACREALAAVAPSLPADLLDLSLLESSAGPVPLELPAPAAGTAPTETSASPLAALVGLAAGVLFAVAGATGGADVPDEVTLATAPVEIAAPTADRAALRQGLLDAGVAPHIAMVPDMSAMGYTLVDARVEDGPRKGVVVTYEKDGQRFHCRIYGAFQTGTVPLETRTVNGVVLRGFDDGAGGGVVAWTAKGRTCLFSGPAPVGELLALIEMRVGGKKG